MCPRLIGRDGALTSLRQLVDHVVGGGDRRTVLVAGEAGLGKSRLVAEVMAYARARGARVLAGASFPEDRTSPFAPIVDMLRVGLAGASEDQRAATVRPFARELAPLLPDLFPAAQRTADVRTQLDLEHQRHQLLVALSRCLLGPGPDQSTGPPNPPTCLVLEDLHWCDDASLDLLAFLARGREHGAARRPLLLVATYRAEDAEPALRAWLGQLDRERLGVDVALAPLTRDDTLQMLGATLPGASPPVGLVDAIHELAEGNPFRIEELLGALVAAGDLLHDGQTWHWKARPVAGWRLPRSLREAVLPRVERLSAPARELLTLASVVGRRFDFELLQQLTQTDERTLLSLVKTLVGAQLVVEESGERFAFRHALTRQVVYAELLARERLALHRVVADTAERLYGDALEQHVDDLAYHFFEAGVWEKALAYARRAAERARHLHAPRTAVEQLTRAIESGRCLPGHGVGVLPSLHLERARAADTIGDGAAAVADASHALRLAEEAGDRRAAWQARLELGLLWAGRDYGRAGPHLEAAHALAVELGDPVLLGHSLNRLGNWRGNARQPRDAIPLHRQALGIFEQLGDQPGVAATLDLLGTAAYLSGDLVAGSRYLERAARILERLDDRPALISCLSMLSERGGSYELGSSRADAFDLTSRFDSGLRDGERAVALAREIGWSAGEAIALSQLARVLGILGEDTRALAAADRANAIAWSIDHRQWGAAAGRPLPPAGLRRPDRGPRHRTLRAAIDWSHQLLDDGEQALFRRLAVFVGGFALDAVEGLHGADALPRLLRLVDKSLVVAERRGAGERYRMLETIRQYAEEKLVDAGEAAALRDRHRDWFLGLAERGAAGLAGPRQPEWLDRLEVEHDNLRAALSWCQANPAGAEQEEQLASALGRFWSTRGYLAEGAAWLAHAAARRPGAVSPARGQALGWAGLLEHNRGASERGRALLEESAAILRRTTARGALSLALRHLFLVAVATGEDRRDELLEEAVANARAAGDRRETGFGLMFLARSAILRGDVGDARRLADEALVALRGLGPGSLGSALHTLGLVALADGDHERAHTLFREVLELARRTGNRLYAADALGYLSDVARARGDLGEARRRCAEAAAELRPTQYRNELGAVLMRLAGLEAVDGDARRAARLAGAWDRFRGAAASGWPLTQWGWRLAQHERDVALVRERLAEEAFAAAFAEGQALEVTQALDEALAPPAEPSRRPSGGGPLTPREREVAALVAEGRTNRQIAEALVVVETTAERHVANILNKLGFHSRAQIAAWHERGASTR